MEDKGFLEDTDDYYDDFGFNVEPDCIQKTADKLPSFLNNYLSQGSSQQRKIKCAFISIISIIFAVFCLLLFIGVIVLITQLSGSDDSSESSDINNNTPNVPDVFSSEIYEIITYNGYFIGNISGFIYTDNNSRNSRIDYTLIEDGDESYEHINNEYLNKDNMKLVDNGICRFYPQQYNDIFSFVPHSTYNGNVTINDKSYQVWIFSELIDSKTNATFWMISDGNTPIVLNVTVTAPDFLLEESIYFVNFEADSIESSIFDTPEECLGDGIICEGKGIETIEMISYTPNIIYDLQNINTGDLNGAAAGICQALEQNALRDVDYISLYTVQVNSSWGQYGICNPNTAYCNGANTYTVGRAAAFKVTDMEGQCSDHSETGTWFSLTAGAECSEYEQIGDNNCAWKQVARNKTITVECLTGLNYQQGCSLDHKLPYTTAASILQDALNVCEDVSTTQSKKITEPAQDIRLSPFVAFKHLI